MESSRLSQVFSTAGFYHIARFVQFLDTEQGRQLMFLSLDLEDPIGKIDIGSTDQSPREYFEKVGTRLSRPDMQASIVRLDAACRKHIEENPGSPLPRDFFSRATPSFGDADHIALFNDAAKKLSRKPQ